MTDERQKNIECYERKALDALLNIERLKRLNCFVDHLGQVVRPCIQDCETHERDFQIIADSSITHILSLLSMTDEEWARGDEADTHGD